MLTYTLCEFVPKQLFYHRSKSKQFEKLENSNFFFALKIQRKDLFAICKKVCWKVKKWKQYIHLNDIDKASDLDDVKHRSSGFRYLDWLIIAVNIEIIFKWHTRWKDGFFFRQVIQRYEWIRFDILRSYIMALKCKWAPEQWTCLCSEF